MRRCAGKCRGTSMLETSASRAVRSNFAALAIAIAIVAGLAIATHPADAPAAAASDRIVRSQDYSIRVVTVASGLDIPWGMAFLDRDRILLTEKPGRMRIIEGGKLLPQPVAGVPPVRVHGQGGLLDVSLHPRFAT